MPDPDANEDIASNDPVFPSKEGRPDPRLGPSDSSDSGSDAPDAADTDSDAAGTGERAGAEPPRHGEPAPDIDTDKVVGARRAGLATTPPDPVRNGGRR